MQCKSHCNSLFFFIISTLLDKLLIFRCGWIGVSLVVLMDQLIWIWWSGIRTYVSDTFTLYTLYIIFLNEFGHSDYFELLLPAWRQGLTSTQILMPASKTKWFGSVLTVVDVYFIAQSILEGKKFGSLDFFFHRRTGMTSGFIALSTCTSIKFFQNFMEADFA